MWHDHIDEHDHWHVISPHREFIQTKYNTEAEAIGAATRLQGEWWRYPGYRDDQFYHILGVPEYCKCDGKY